MELRSLKLETDRLLLRAYRRSDAEALYTMVQANIDALRRPMPLTIVGNKTVGASRKFISLRNADRKIGNKLGGGIFIRSSGKLIGQITIVAIDHRVPKCEIGYFIDQQEHGKGYATEALKAILKHAFEELGMIKIGLRIEPSNPASAAVAAKCGFLKTGHLRKEFRSFDSDLMDVDWWELLREEYFQS